MELGAENQAQANKQNCLIEFCETGVTTIEPEIFHALELQLSPRHCEEQLKQAELVAVVVHIVTWMKPEMEHECAGHRVLIGMEVASKESLWQMHQFESSLGDMKSHPIHPNTHQTLTWWLI